MVGLLVWVMGNATHKLDADERWNGGQIPVPPGGI
jgi:hypothetical protein